MKLCIIDLETTGIDASTHEIIEIGAILLDNYQPSETFSIKVHPFHISTADPEALAVNGYVKEEWSEAFLLPNALRLLTEFIGATPVYLMAYNVSFDRAFLEKAYRECNLSYPFHYHHLDLLTMAWMHTPQDLPLSLKAVCEYHQIESEPIVHRALSGATCAYHLYKKLI